MDRAVDVRSDIYSVGATLLVRAFWKGRPSGFASISAGTVWISVLVWKCRSSSVSSDRLEGVPEVELRDLSAEDDAGDV